MAYMPAPLGNDRARKSWEKTFESYSWAKDDNIPEKHQRQELSQQIVKLTKAKSQWKPSDRRIAEADRLLAIMREKAKDAAKHEGRYFKKAVAVDEAEAQLDQCDEVQEVLHAKLTKLGNSMLKNVEQLGNLRDALDCQHQATALAGRSAVQVANELLAGGDPDEPVDDLCPEDATFIAATNGEEVEEPPAKRPHKTIFVAGL